MDEVTLGVTLGVSILFMVSAVALIAVWRYKQQMERQRPIDFVEYWRKMQSKTPDLQVRATLTALCHCAMGNYSTRCARSPLRRDGVAV